MTSKPSLSFWQIWNMCFGFLGIQFGFALQNANVSRIFQTLGADVHEIAILWVAAPVTGLVIQPIIGYMSDRTWNRLGRRRPYFLYGAIATTAALFFMPNSPVLWVAAGMLWIMDASINVSMEPFRAFVGDMLPNKQRTKGFAMQSFFIGVGAVVASAMPWMLSNWFDVSNIAPEGVVPDSVKYSFYFGGVVLFLAVLWTVVSTREYSPEQLAEFDDAEPETEQTSVDLAEGGGVRRSAEKYLSGALIWFLAGVLSTGIIWYTGLDQQLYILSVSFAVFGVMQFIAANLMRRNKTDNGFFEVVDDLFHMPETMKQLAVVQFFSWFGLFTMWIYSTPAVTGFHFGTLDPTSAEYNEGANWVGILFAAYNGFAALAAFAIPVIAARIGRKYTHLACLWIGGLGLGSFLFFKDPQMLIISMVAVGIAWCAILSIPYAILSGALPAKKMGVYMGIFNFFIVIPQILSASVMGFLLRTLADNQSIYALVMAGASLFIAGLMVLRVKDNLDQ